MFLSTGKKFPKKVPRIKDKKFLKTVINNKAQLSFNEAAHARAMQTPCPKIEKASL